MATLAHDTHLDIGDFRKIRLKTNAKGYWEIWWTDAAAGRYLTRRESCRTTVRAQAQAYLDVFLNAARQATVAASSSQLPTVEELCVRWLTHVAPLGKDTIGRHVLVSVRRLLGRCTPGQLDASTLHDYARERATGDASHRAITSGSIRRELGALRTVLLWAARQRLVSHDDLPMWDGVLPPEGAPRTRFLDAAGERWFWDQAMAWEDPAVKLFVALGLSTAARREAIVELTWDRVDLNLGLIDYRVPGRRVTKKRRVRVPISDRLMPVLKEEARLKAPSAQSTVLGVSPSSLSWRFGVFVRAIGVPWVTPHVLRHTWGSLKAMQGAPLYDIAQVMGDTVQTIEASYLHLTPDHLRRVVNF